MTQYIVLEGLDGSGKATQSRLLREHFQQQDLRVHLLSFPIYTSLFGSYIKTMLKSGTRNDAKSMALWYALDRWTAFDQLDHIEPYDIVICDRYVYSNMVYQYIRMLAEPTYCMPFQEWITWCSLLEYTILHIPKATCCVYLDVSEEITRTWLIKEYGDVEHLDVFEQNMQMQHLARQYYQELVQCSPECHMIACYDQHGVFTAEYIHQQIVHEIANR